MNTATNRLISQTATRPAVTDFLFAVASTLLCLNLRESLATQASAEHNDSADLSWGM